MAHFFSTHKKLCIIVGVILAVLLLALYLYAAFLPGVWHRDAFLYLQKDGSFTGSDLYAEYKMSIDAKENGAEIDFSVNDITKNYKNKRKIYKKSPVKTHRRFLYRIKIRLEFDLFAALVSRLNSSKCHSD